MKRRSMPKQRKKKNTYDKKRKSGRMMYGPAPKTAIRDGRVVIVP